MYLVKMAIVEGKVSSVLISVANKRLISWGGGGGGRWYKMETFSMEIYRVGQKSVYIRWVYTNVVFYI